MDKRANIVMDNLIHIVIFAMFFGIMFWGIGSYSDGSALIEDIYAKEIVRLINAAEPGMSFKLDVSKLAVVANKNGKKFEETIYVDNVNNELRVSSRLGSGTIYKFFNDVDIVNFRVESVSGNSIATRFLFEVVERQRAGV
ncbi:MAG: hypothetical protein FJZ43_03720 [Candidatus Staskawiczbacteria bacterium]|nr:hypothetical protein [Candidatus Staskawiczbacteria bacterium]